MTWERIRRGKLEIFGVYAADAARLDVRISLDSVPPPEWSTFFISPTRLRVEPTMKAPGIDGQFIWIRPQDAELDAYVDHVDKRIATANDRYEQEVLPRLRIQQPRDLDAAARQFRRLEQAKRQADRL